MSDKHSWPTAAAIENEFLVTQGSKKNTASIPATGTTSSTTKHSDSQSAPSATAACSTETAQRKAPQKSSRKPPRSSARSSETTKRVRVTALKLQRSSAPPPTPTTRN